MFDGICQKGDLTLGDDAPAFVKMTRDCTWTEHTAKWTSSDAYACAEDDATNIKSIPLEHLTWDLEEAKKLCELKGACCTHVRCKPPV
jgi:hypothetical protein